MSSSKAKKERRQERHRRNQFKDETHKKNAWAEGKIIYENHNGGEFSEDYSIDLSERLYNILKDLLRLHKSNKATFIDDYRKYKNSIIDCILKYNHRCEKNFIYEFLKTSLETYWDTPEYLYQTLENL